MLHVPVFFYRLPGQTCEKNAAFPNGFWDLLWLVLSGHEVFLVKPRLEAPR